MSTVPFLFYLSSAFNSEHCYKASVQNCRYGLISGSVMSKAEATVARKNDNIRKNPWEEFDLKGIQSISA